MRLLLLHPNVATRDCDHCQKFEYDETTGKVREWRGKPLKRVKGCPAPCRTSKGCPKGTPEEQKTLTHQNAHAYRHYLECRAVGSFPDDPIVRQNARIIRAVEDDCDRLHQVQLAQLTALRNATRG